MSSTNAGVYRHSPICRPARSGSTLRALPFPCNHCGHDPSLLLSSYHCNILFLQLVLHFNPPDRKYHFYTSVASLVVRCQRHYVFLMAGTTRRGAIRFLPLQPLQDRRLGLPDPLRHRICSAYRASALASFMVLHRLLPRMCR